MGLNKICWLKDRSRLMAALNAYHVRVPVRRYKTQTRGLPWRVPGGQWLRLGLPVQPVQFSPWFGSLDCICLVAKKTKQEEKQYYNKFNEDFTNGLQK